MTILIDGYNLLNATGVEGTGRGTELERARRGLLQFLASALSPAEAAATTIVFDAQGAPPGLPRQETFQAITILFSKGYAEADDLLEELIATDHVPRSLLVVSSDHRLHRAARRRKATAIDSDIWMAQLESRGGSGRSQAQPNLGSTEDWLAEFADLDIEAIENELLDKPKREESNGAKEPPCDAPAPNEGVNSLDDIANPFPEGFGSELDEEFGWADDLANPFPDNFGEDLFEEEDEP